MERYVEPDVDTLNMFESLKTERFEHLDGARFKLIVDLKPKINKLKGSLVFAYVRLSTKVEKYLVMQQNKLYDYFIFISGLVWDIASKEDKKRILSHELRHCIIDNKGDFKTVGHEIEDFYAELQLNEDDPMWKQSLNVEALAEYDRIKEQEKANK